jgi:hypothetical protein
VARLAIPVCLLALVVAGCGGGGGDDKEKVQQTVRDFVKAVNIESTKVDGDRATITVRIGRAGSVTRQQIQLQKDDGDWKISGGTG